MIVTLAHALCLVAENSIGATPSAPHSARLTLTKNNCERIFRQERDARDMHTHTHTHAERTDMHATLRLHTHTQHEMSSTIVGL